MSSLVIEGDPGAIEHLLEELSKHNYLSNDFYHGVFRWDVLIVAREIEAAMQKADDDA